MTLNEPALRGTISDPRRDLVPLLLCQVEDLKRDKDDLRADKEALKQEITKLASELQRSLAGEGISSRAAGSATHLSTVTGHSAQTAVLPEKRKLGSDAPTPPRKRGCPSKDKQRPAGYPIVEITVPRKRGRPRKVPDLGGPLPQTEDTGVSTPTMRGGPRKDIKATYVAAGSASVQQLATRAVKVGAAFVFTKQQSQAVLKETPALAVVPEPVITVASRDFYHKTYGGSPCQSVQIIQPHKNPSGKAIRMFLFPAYDVNPHLPSIPGQPGFLIDNRYFRKSVPQPWSLFRRVSEKVTGLKSTWMYLGEYEYTPAGKMPVEVFNAQSEMVQRKWAEDFLKRVEAGNGRPMDEDDVVAAFSAGDEAIDITILKCVSYDRVLAQDIASKFALFGTSRRGSSGEAKGQASPIAGISSGQQQDMPSTSGDAATSVPSSSRAARRLANMFSNPLTGTIGLSLGAWSPEASGQSDGDEDDGECQLYDSEEEVAALSCL